MDNVNHPAHYKKNGMECIDVIEAFELNFCRGNAVKYILRAGAKDNEFEDLNKAAWYLKHEIDSMIKAVALPSSCHHENDPQ